ncbi:ribbon-helix-helix domain-containing protein [Aestuariivirga sp.]|uniref:ribbon-helix-helix domain-containing protein n=1 Tax=Aestuariivirga sp. TaxID=2650926 RepID=UPI0039E236CE
MKKDAAKRSRGRPATGRGEQINVRLLPDLLSAVDKHMEATGAESRPETIRQILTEFLKRRGLF